MHMQHINAGILAWVVVTEYVGAADRGASNNLWVMR